MFRLDKNSLSNLELSLQKEFICVSENGSYASTTIAGCNCRKYHGLFVCPQPKLNQDNFVLLSCVEETLSQHGREFHLGVQKYAGDVFSPKGHKYAERFEYRTHPVWTYHIGGAVLRKELLMHPAKNRLLIKYTLEEAHSETFMDIRPFLAFRDAHELTVQNDAACTQVQYVQHGIKCRLYPGFSDLCMQFSKECGFSDQPDWYKNVKYSEEEQRGYPCHEDLFTPGHFHVSLPLHEPVYVSVGTSPMADPAKAAALFEEAVEKLPPHEGMDSSLKAAARSFIVKKEDRRQVTAGYPWFGSWGRDTFISLPGLTLCTGNTKLMGEVLRSMLKDLSNGLFPNIGYGGEAAYNSVDAPLWFVWAVQQYALHTKKTAQVWGEFGQAVRQVIDGYAKGNGFGIGMTPEGLIYAGKQGYALTWMDAVVHGHPVTPRAGMPVEINALWYNAVMFAMECEKKCSEAKRPAFVAKWKPLMDKFPEVFKANFWSKEKGYLADCIDNGSPDWSIRPNQILAVSLPYSPVSDKVGQLVVETVKTCLLTPRGLRTLAPSDPRYRSVYQGPQEERDRAYHQGTAWVWLTGHFAQAYLRVYGEAGKSFIERLYLNFEPALWEAGIGSISEIYDADPPYAPKGAFSQAWSVAELLRIRKMLS
ncbi:MAG: amylo-alpha-1,6-glucosidase [Bacteroides sp.]|nr:amylo-alpha-1,6-glucosidase [Ruminococcus flavefaciens]MCM1555349.1 amylo-alpha-1,6-glucosidase [Bacteroides sp.]